MKNKILISAVFFLTIACTPHLYNIKKEYDGDIITIKITGGIPPKEANKVIGYIHSNIKLIQQKFATQSLFFFSEISYWSRIPGLDGKDSECKYDVTFYNGYDGDTLCIGIYKNKLKALWSSRWVEESKESIY